MDCKRVVDDLNNLKLDRLEYSSIISQCRAALLSLKNKDKVVFIRRHVNGSVHALTQTFINTLFAILLRAFLVVFGTLP